MRNASLLVGLVLLVGACAPVDDESVAIAVPNAADKADGAGALAMKFDWDKSLSVYEPYFDCSEQKWCDADIRFAVDEAYVRAYAAEWFAAHPFETEMVAAPFTLLVVGGKDIRMPANVTPAMAVTIVARRPWATSTDPALIQVVSNHMVIIGDVTRPASPDNIRIEDGVIKLRNMPPRQHVELMVMWHERDVYLGTTPLGPKQTTLNMTAAWE